MTRKPGKRQRKTDEGTGSYNVQLYSRCASLVNEYQLDAEEHDLADMDAAEDFVRRTLTPSEFASTVSLAAEAGPNDEIIRQFELKRA